jgi:hypothetical protein
MKISYQRACLKMMRDRPGREIPLFFLIVIFRIAQRFVMFYILSIMIFILKRQREGEPWGKKIQLPANHCLAVKE